MIYIYIYICIYIYTHIYIYIYTYIYIVIIIVAIRSWILNWSLGLRVEDRSGVVGPLFARVGEGGGGVEDSDDASESMCPNIE